MPGVAIKGLAAPSCFPLFWVIGVQMILAKLLQHCCSMVVSRTWNIQTEAEVAGSSNQAEETPSERNEVRGYVIDLLF